MTSTSEPSTSSSRGLSSGAATEALLALGLKPVARELHHLGHIDEASARWQAMGYSTARGEPVREDIDTAAMVVDVKQIHTTRHLATHPVIERMVALGGRSAERLLLSPSSRVHQWLAERLDAERTPHQGPLPSGERVQERCALYVSKDQVLAERARALDRMAEASRESDGARELGALLGYPACCVEAFASLPRRWPNRFPIEAAIARTEHFAAHLNNLALDRFAWIAWFPCRYDCTASLEIAKAAATALHARVPGQAAEAERALARPRIYIDDAQQAALIDAKGTPEALSFKRLEPLTRRGEEPGALWHPLREADNLQVRDGALVFYAGKRRLTWEGDALFLPFGLS